MDLHNELVVPARFGQSSEQAASEPVCEAPREFAHRLSEALRGLLADEVAARGGAEGFVRWVRSENGE